MLQVYRQVTLLMTPIFTPLMEIVTRIERVIMEQLSHPRRMTTEIETAEAVRFLVKVEVTGVDDYKSSR